MLVKDNNKLYHDGDDHDDDHDDDNSYDFFPEQVDVYKTDSFDEVSRLIGDESTRSVVRKISKQTNDNKNEYLQLEPIERGNRGILIVSGSEDTSVRFSCASRSTTDSRRRREELLSLLDSSFVPSDIQSLDLEQDELSSVHCSMMGGRSAVVGAAEKSESQPETMMNRSGTSSQTGTINHHHIVQENNSAATARKNDDDNDASTATVPRRKNVSVYTALAVIALTLFFVILLSYFWISKRYWRHDALQLREELASMKELVNEMTEKREPLATTNEIISWKENDLQDDDKYPHHVETNLDNSWVEADACGVVGTSGNKEQAKEKLFSSGFLFDKVSSGGNNNNSNNSNKRWWYNMKKVATCGGNRPKSDTTTTAVAAVSRLAHGAYSMAKYTWRTVFSPVYQFENAQKSFVFSMSTNSCSERMATTTIMTVMSVREKH